MKPIKAYLNVLAYRANMLLKSRVIGNYPVAAYIEPTLFCNLRCPACPTGLQLGLRPAATLPWDLYKTILDEIGDYLFYLGMYHLGEPFLHKQTPEFIQYAKSKHIYVTLSSNLSLNLSDDYIERIVRSGLDMLTVSCDGVTAETYSHYRRRGTFEQVRDNMQRIQATKARLGVSTPHIVWQFLVFRHNQHEIPQVQAVYKEWGADSVDIHGGYMPFAPHDEGFEPSTIAEYNVYHPNHVYNVRTRQQLARSRSCSWLYGIFLMSPNKSVAPCCGTTDEKDDFGNYEPEQGFFAIWNNHMFQAARALFASKKPYRVQTSDVDKIHTLGHGLVSKPRDQNPYDKLICHTCPIPYRQNDADRIMLQEAYNLAIQVVKQGDVRALLAFVCMGGPMWYLIPDILFGTIIKRLALEQHGVQGRGWHRLVRVFFPSHRPSIPQK